MVQLSATTANLDFTLPKAKVKEDLDEATKVSDVLCFQEGKSVNVDSLLPPDWNSNQRVKTDAKAGSGVGWNRTVLQKKNTGLKVGTRPRGVKMLTRYISWVNLSFHTPTGVRKLRVVSVHLPPQRYRWLQPVMLNSLGAFIRSSRLPLLIGGDWNVLVNSNPDLQRFAERVHGEFHGFGIDGFLFVPKKRKNWKITKKRKLRGKNSDHNYFVNVTLET